jgi:uncharacterized protein YebE (UPF0316 family)
VSLLMGGTSSAGPCAYLPFFIFGAEVCVVTISTVRTIFVARGMRYLAPVLGFFEVSIWLFAIGEVMKNLSDFTCSLAFAGGFTLGNFLGILVEQKLAMGSAVVRIITRRDATELIEWLREAGFGVTSVDAHGATGPVQMVFTVVKRKRLGEVLTLAKRFDPRVFYSVDDIQSAADNVPTPERRRLRGLIPAFFHLERAG